MVVLLVALGVYVSSPVWVGRVRLMSWGARLTKRENASLNSLTCSSVNESAYPAYHGQCVVLIAGGKRCSRDSCSWKWGGEGEVFAHCRTIVSVVQSLEWEVISVSRGVLGFVNGTGE